MFCFAFYFQKDAHTYQLLLKNFITRLLPLLLPIIPHINFETNLSLPIINIVSIQVPETILGTSIIVVTLPICCNNN